MILVHPTPRDKVVVTLFFGAVFTIRTLTQRILLEAGRVVDPKG